LNKYLSTRSLGRPIRRSTLHSTAIVYRAKLLFGQKAVETEDPQAKARLVVGGHIGFTPDGHVAIKHKRTAEQKVHGDYWTPGASLAAVRFLCSHAALHGNVLSSKDLSQAYLQTVTTERQSFIQLPLTSDMLQYFPDNVRADIQKLREQGVADTDILFPVIASLYGLPSAGYSYWRALEDHLVKHEWQRLDSDGGALWMKDGNLLCVYVDDLLLSCKRADNAIIWKRDILADRWTADDEPIQVTTRYLGLYLHQRPNGGYLVEQGEYGRSIVRTYTAMTGVPIRPRTTLPQRTADTPDLPSTFPPTPDGHVADDPNIPEDMDAMLAELAHVNDSPDIPTHFQAQQHAYQAITTQHATVTAAAAGPRKAPAGKKTAPGKKTVDPVHSTIGALMYLSRGSRPDLAWAVQRAAEAIHSWTPANKKFLEHLLGFILTHDRGLEYDPLPKGSLISDVRPCGYTDSNYIAPASRSGVLYTLQTINGDHQKDTAWTHVIDWSSRKQRYSSLSSAQAETVALNAGTRLVQETTATVHAAFPTIKNTPFIFCDSAPALAAVRRGWSRSLSTCSRAVGCAVQWLHDVAAEDAIRFRWLDGKINPADSLTKPLGDQKCQLAPMMSTRSSSGTWSRPSHRTEGALYVPRSTQPLWTQGVAKCYICGDRKPLCHKCKACSACGCECVTDKSVHPVEDPEKLPTKKLPNKKPAGSDPVKPAATQHNAGSDHVKPANINAIQSNAGSDYVKPADFNSGSIYGYF
jgi:hypothetical protein